MLRIYLEPIEGHTYVQFSVSGIICSSIYCTFSDTKGLCQGKTQISCIRFIIHFFGWHNIFCPKLLLMYGKRCPSVILFCFAPLFLNHQPYFVKIQEARSEGSFAGQDILLTKEINSARITLLCYKLPLVLCIGCLTLDTQLKVP